MNRTTTVIVALIAAASLSTMVYAVPEQRALAWLGGFLLANNAINACSFGCGGFFDDVFHKHIIQTINQLNRTPPPPPPISHPTVLTLNLMFKPIQGTLPTNVTVSGTLTDTSTGLGVSHSSRTSRLLAERI
jgi:hypothetical protein